MGKDSVVEGREESAVSREGLLGCAGDSVDGCVRFYGQVVLGLGGTWPVCLSGLVVILVMLDTGGGRSYRLMQLGLC